MRILIDARRPINSGVGRVAQWLNLHLPLIFPDAQWMHLINHRDQGDHFQDECILTRIAPFSAGDFHDLGAEVQATGCDLYISTGTVWSPLHTVPSVCMVHDIWSLMNPDWLPSPHDVCARFGIRNMGYFEGLVQWMSSQDRHAILTPDGISRHDEVLASGNLIWQAAWAQAVAILTRASAVVSVSDAIRSGVERWFKQSDRVVSVPNIPRAYVVCKDGRPKRYLLSLAKLEARKNLDVLIDAYVQFCDAHPGQPLPILLMAGDYGYADVASRLRQKIGKLVHAGYKIELPGVLDDIQLANIFAQSHALISTSHFEGFGLPPMEAMLSGVPVIATATGMIRSELGRYAICVEDARAEQLAQAMDRVVHQGVGADWLDTARKAAQSHFNSIQPEARWKQVILSALQQTHTGAR
jgi:glycosyltransferase involved in cell wall biosynthesis